MSKPPLDCIDCKHPLYTDVRSRQQPTLRCQDCFDVFAKGVEAVLQGKATSAREAARQENPDGQYPD